MRATTFRIAPLLLLLAACATSQPDTVDSASSSSSVFVASGSGTTYTNDGYGFSVTLPSHFEAFKGRKPVSRKYGAYFKDNVLQYEGSTDAIMSLESIDMDIPYAFGVYIDVLPIEGYNRIELYDEEPEYVYDVKTDSWTGANSKKKVDFGTRMIGGKKAYEFGFGDAGQAIATYAVMLPEKNVALEFIFGSCPACTEDPVGLSEDQALVDANYAHIQKETEEILDGIRFQ